MDTRQETQCDILDIEIVASLAPCEADKVIVNTGDLLHKSMNLAAPNENDIQVLKRLWNLMPSLAKNYRLKAEKWSGLRLKLWDPGHLGQRKLTSFIALSFRWQWDINEPGTPDTPMAPALFQAFIDQRQENEGLWCDQICIPQDNDEQKSVQISLMDAIYLNARLIVVTLNDIEITKTEWNAAQEYVQMCAALPGEEAPHLTDNPPLMDTHSILQFYLKIVSSAWFVRAWCIHEFRLGIRHVFLVQLAQRGSEKDHRVVRFTGKFFSQLHDLFGKVRTSTRLIGRVDPRLFMSLLDIFKRKGLEEFLRSHGEVADLRIRIDNKFEIWGRLCHEVMTFAVAGGNQKLPTPQLREYDGNKDKIAILLNIIGSSLAQNTKLMETNSTGEEIPLLTMDEAFRQLTLLGLAERDPVMLCTTGARLRLGDEGAASIFSRPREEDVGTNNFGALPKLPSELQIYIDQDLPHRYTELNMHILDVQAHASTVTLDADETFYDRANRFVSLCKSLNQINYDDPQSTTLIKILASCFQCGKGWMQDASALQEIIGFRNFPTALESIFDNDFNVRDAGTKPAAFKLWTTSIVHFVKALYTFGPPHNPDTDTSIWRPVILTDLSRKGSTPSDQNQHNCKLVVFAPRVENLVIGIPDVLTPDPYRYLHRAWIMQRVNSSKDALNASMPVYRLLGKSRVFNDAPFMLERSFGWETSSVRVCADD